MGFFQLSGPAETVGAGGTLELATLAEAQAYLELEADAGGPEDTILQLCLNEANLTAFREMGSRFVKLVTTDFVHIHDVLLETKVLYVRQKPITLITSIDIGEMTDDTTFTATKTLATGDYYLDADGGRIFTRWFSSWPQGEHVVRVRYRAGFTTIPYELTAAVCKLAGVLLVRQREKSYGISSIAQGSTAKSFTAEIPDSVANVFRRWSIESVGVPYG